MCAICKLLASSLGKKYIMALTGLVLVLFVFGHMVGNLQVFLPPEYINAYAEKLHALGPVLWVIRAFLLVCVVAHIVTAIQLVIANNKARPNDYKVEQTIQASFDRRATIESVTSLRGSDLPIEKDGNGFAISASWERKVPIIHNVSALVEFEVES